VGYKPRLSVQIQQYFEANNYWLALQPLKE
jgi:hypothetical protein